MENFIFGFTGAFGSGCSFIIKEFFQNRRNAKVFSLSSELKIMFANDNPGAVPSRNVLQEYGNHVRSRDGANVLANKVLGKIGDEVAGGSITKDTLICIDSIRNPEEIKKLREAFPRFILVAVFAGHEKRWERVKTAYESKHDAFQDDEYKDQGSDEPAYGQRIADCFFEADVIISNDDEISIDGENDAYHKMSRKLDQYVRSFMDPTQGHPLIVESLMASAYASGRRSRCLKRKVGAIIVDENGSIISSGYNDVPFTLKTCQQKHGNCYRSVKKAQMEALIAGIINEDHDKSTKIISKFKILDFCRAVHAEENAILNLVRNSSRTDYSKCTLYTTTYPCNLCANKIAQIGIKNIVYFEPYPIVEAYDILAESSVTQVSFEGVTFRAFFRAYNFLP